MKLVKSKDTKLIHRNLLLFYTLTTKCQKEKLRKQSQSPLHQKYKIKYIAKNLPKKAKDLFTVNDVNEKKLKTTLTDWKIYRFWGLEELKLLKMTMLLKAIIDSG